MLRSVLHKVPRRGARTPGGDDSCPPGVTTPAGAPPGRARRSFFARARLPRVHFAVLVVGCQWMRGSELELVAFAGHGDVDDAAAVLTFSDPREDDRPRPRDEDGSSEEAASGARVSCFMITSAAPSLARSPDW